MIESGTGAYEDNAGSWWDACAPIELDGDGSGTGAAVAQAIKAKTEDRAVRGALGS